MNMFSRGKTGKLAKWRAGDLWCCRQTVLATQLRQQLAGNGRSSLPLSTQSHSSFLCSARASQEPYKYSIAVSLSVCVFLIFSDR